MEGTDGIRGATTLPCRHNPGISFFDLPRELRDMVYQQIPENNGVFTYDIHVRRRELLWRNDVVGSPKNGRFFEEQYANHGVGFGTGSNRHAILRTCRTIYTEALPIVYGSTPLGIWRPMVDYGGVEKYASFTNKVFESLPVHAGKHIRTLQIQGELWQRSMGTLLEAVAKQLPALEVVEIALDPYYDNDKRRTWFDGGEARQLWPAVAQLAIRAQQLELINITFAPPQDVIYIWQAEAKGIWLSGARYQRFIWSYLQWLVIKHELTMYNGLVHSSPKTALSRSMTVLGSRDHLLNIAARTAVAETYLTDMSNLHLEHEEEWLRGCTGRTIVEMDEKGQRIVMMSLRDASTRWCKMTYSACPGGFADPEGLLSS